VQYALSAGSCHNNNPVTACLFAVIAGDEQQLLLDVDASGVSSALQWLNRYKLRRKVTLEDVSSQVAVWAAFDGELKAGPEGGCMRMLGVNAVQSWFWFHLHFCWRTMATSSLCQHQLPKTGVGQWQQAVTCKQHAT
jgi:hypothetical protein